MPGSRQASPANQERASRSIDIRSSSERSIPTWPGSSANFHSSPFNSYFWETNIEKKVSVVQSVEQSNISGSFGGRPPGSLNLFSGPTSHCVSIELVQFELAQLARALQTGAISCALIRYKTVSKCAFELEKAHRYTRVC